MQFNVNLTKQSISEQTCVRMRLDEALKEIGGFGIYQKRLYGSLIPPMISTGTLMLVVVVVLFTPKHRCKIPGLDNDTFAVQDNQHEYLINISIPRTSDGLVDKCHVFDTRERGNNVTLDVIKCDEWVYDKSVFTSTFTEKTNLVCGDAMKVAHAQTFFFFGVFSGDIILGIIADRFGRKVGLYTAFISEVIASIATSWAPGIYVLGFMQFVVGGACHAAFVIASVLALEMVGQKTRAWTGILLHVWFTMGLTYLCLMSYLIRDWKYINLACALPTVIYLTYWWVIPESARWLASKGKQDEYGKLLQRASRTNGVKLPDEAFVIDKSLLNTEYQEGNMLDIAKNPVLRVRTAILCFAWFVIGMSYYGSTINAGNMAGDFFLNFLLLIIAGFPGYMITVPATERIGRRRSNSLCLCVGGLASFCTIFTVLFGGPELQPATIALAVIGKAGAAGAFSCVYLFSSEILPTVVRNAGLGVCSSAARVGAMLAPYIAKSGELIGGKFGQAEPLVIFGTLSIVAGLVLNVLPETLHQKLPDTLEEGERFGRHYSIEEKDLAVTLHCMPNEDKEIEDANETTQISNNNF